MHRLHHRDTPRRVAERFGAYPFIVCTILAERAQRGGANQSISEHVGARRRSILVHRLYHRDTPRHAAEHTRASFAYRGARGAWRSTLVHRCRATDIVCGSNDVRRHRASICARSRLKVTIWAFGAHPPPPPLPIPLQLPCPLPLPTAPPPPSPAPPRRCVCGSCALSISWFLFPGKAPKPLRA